ncbi:MAG: hypothetical protein M1816_006699 [Peltula sp. TS41687]|nr:MAG: hypothetical protein M1816_006699 [Peltula sp. TS41687]
MHSHTAAAAPSTTLTSGTHDAPYAQQLPAAHTPGDTGDPHTEQTARVASFVTAIVSLHVLHPPHGKSGISEIAESNIREGVQNVLSDQTRQTRPER